MLPMEQLSALIQEHLGQGWDPAPGAAAWVAGESALGGRGLLAVRDIAPGQVLFVDHPLLCGPRSGTNIHRGCTVCSKINDQTSFKCPKCSLLLCSVECQSSTAHHNDCALITRWPNKVPIEEVDDTLLSRALTSIRALLLDEKSRQFLCTLQAHFQPPHGNEVRDLSKYFDIPKEEEKLMILASCVLDANAYQISNQYGEGDMHKRGLYPVASLMNHDCVPNTRHAFNSDFHMIVIAVKAIPAGAELCTCYTGLLWGTPARRVHLAKTKHFLCACARCADPFEGGTLLAALKCFQAECGGLLLPARPLQAAAPWRCMECDLQVPASNVADVQRALGSLVSTVDLEDVDGLEKFLLERITKFIPKTNQIVLDIECRLIWLLGEKDGLRWHELSEQRLSLKERLCRGALRTLAALGAGDAYLRGLLLYHLHAALAERARRAPLLYEELKPEIESTIEQAYNILKDGISGPPDLELRRRYLGPAAADKPREERFFILDNKSL
ncbi:unnamed protein product [Plutella xylostella]|uniref:(diamondback moth) hypothetical protein n=1 Tax=Plutella xylostella TaxID=51655 RepID=A0A8S4DDL0_PLUXY|nr:unnamed protein product [Plutella xylostella]